MVTATCRQVELPLAKQILLKPREIRIVRVVSKRLGLLYFESTETIVRQGHLVPAKSIAEGHRNVQIYKLVNNHTNITVQVPKHFVICVSSDSMVYIIAPAKVDREHRHTAATIQAYSKLPV